MIKNLHNVPWRNVAGCLIIILVFGNAFALRYTSFPIAQLIAACLMLAKYGADLPVQASFAKRARAESKSNAYCVALLLPTFMTAFVTLSVKMAWSLFDFTHQLAEQPLAIKLDYLNKSSYNTALLVVLVASVVDIPVSLLAIHIVALDPDLRARAHAVVLAITVYSLVIMLADRKLLRRSAHSMDAKEIRLRIGARFHADIPTSSVDHIEEVQEQERLWCVRKQVRWFETMKVTPFDQPNAVIVMKDGAKVECSSYGVHCYLPKYVFLYVDEPGILLKNFMEKDRSDSAS